MLDKVKGALRISASTTAFDDEINGLIATGKADLRLVGIVVPEEATPVEGETAVAGDPLIERAVILYAKANFGFNDDSEKYQKAYDHLKCSLSLAGDYNAVE